MNTIRVSNGLYPDQNRRSVGTDLGPNYLQMLSADKERVRNLGNNSPYLHYLLATSLQVVNNG